MWWDTAMKRWENVTETIKKELELEYRQHKAPTATFINEFAEKHKVALPSDILFDFRF